MKTLLAGLILALLAGCPGLESRELRLPPRDPDELVARVRSLAVDEEWSRLYDLLSDRRRKQIPRLVFVVTFSSRRVPPPHDYRIADIIARGHHDGTFFDPSNDERAIVIDSYGEPGKPRYEARVLVVREEGEWHVDGPAE